MTLAPQPCQIEEVGQSFHKTFHSIHGSPRNACEMSDKPPFAERLNDRIGRKAHSTVGLLRSQADPISTLQAGAFAIA